MAQNTIHVTGLKPEEYSEIMQATHDWLKRNHPGGSKSEAWRAWFLEVAKREREK